MAQSVPGDNRWEVEPADAAEQDAAVTPGQGPSGTRTERWDVDPADVAEQDMEVAKGQRPGTRTERWDVDPADAAEQEIEVPVDEDEWR